MHVMSHAIVAMFRAKESGRKGLGTISSSEGCYTVSFSSGHISRRVQNLSPSKVSWRWVVAFGMHVGGYRR